MVRELQSERKGPRSGTVKSVVVFLHGYGADGADLLGLAGPLGQELKDTAFYAPNAPDSCINNPMGFQWFPIPHMDGSDPVEAGAAFAASQVDLNAYLDGVMEAEGIDASQLALIGFSQGTMMSLHLAPRRMEPFACVVGFSGRLLDPEKLSAETLSRPPIQLLHGDADPVVPFASMEEAQAALGAADFDVYTHVMRGTPHGISPEGLSVAYQFLKEFLPG